MKKHIATVMCTDEKIDNNDQSMFILSVPISIWCVVYGLGVVIEFINPLKSQVTYVVIQL
jgi:hypothetical protein